MMFAVLFTVSLSFVVYRRILLVGVMQFCIFLNCFMLRLYVYRCSCMLLMMKLPLVSTIVAHRYGCVYLIIYHFT